MALFRSGSVASSEGGVGGASQADGPRRRQAVAEGVWIWRIGSGAARRKAIFVNVSVGAVDRVKEERVELM